MSAADTEAIRRLNDELAALKLKLQDVEAERMYVFLKLILLAFVHLFRNRKAQLWM